MRQRLLLALLMLSATAAFARQPDGTLDVIITPNSGVPVILARGSELAAVLTAEAALTLADDQGEHKLEPQWTQLPGGRFEARCTLPTDLPEGTYSLAASANGRTDRNPRSVYLRESFPESYVFCHVTDVHIGKDIAGVDPEHNFAKVIEAVGSTDAAFVLVTGDITDTGEPEQFRRFVELLDTCPLPTFVCTGNHDRKALNYENTFGPVTYSFTYGKDGFLVFDTKDFLVAEDYDPEMGSLQRLRRAIKPSRWSIGVTHRYWTDMGMRSQLTLFVDDPLDLLIFGHWHRENVEEKKVPWDTTPIVATPAALHGAWRSILVGDYRIVPQPVQSLGKGE